ncbi:MAG: class I SAM-dependent methyltransferase [Candidatus Pacebacteria bacterium]|nr:class I SAM-dependent methyltransferase [Candidatus Paceibacterota bacterium]
MKADFELTYWVSVLGGLAKPKIPIIPYVPDHREPPARRLEVISAWEGIQNILSDLIGRFHIKTDRCLEFGVEFGFSTVALSSYFDSVVGVDLFCGDRHTLNKRDIYKETIGRISHYSNIELVRSDYRDFIQNEHGTFGLIHVDIVHTFADTFACGLWSAEHSQCTIFHDTESFPQVKQAVSEIARITGKTFYNFSENYGLGILV